MEAAEEKKEEKAEVSVEKLDNLRKGPKVASLDQEARAEAGAVWPVLWCCRVHHGSDESSMITWQVLQQVKITGFSSKNWLGQEAGQSCLSQKTYITCKS